jgi:hypothetical protein
VFFLPGIAALIYAGADYAVDSCRIAEHSNVSADGPGLPISHPIPRVLRHRGVPPESALKGGHDGDVCDGHRH